MIQFACDSCSVVKAPNEVWILGLAAESLGVTASRREVTILHAWDASRAVTPLAVHFCSVECKEDYMASLFGTNGKARRLTSEADIRAAAKPGKRRIKRVAKVVPAKTLSRRVN